MFIEYKLNIRYIHKKLHYVYKRMRYSSILSYNLTINALIFIKYDIENTIPNSQFFQHEIDILIIFINAIICFVIDKCVFF